jgi:hypothetical protein
MGPGRFIRIDHRDCGGGGCDGCHNTGTQRSRTTAPAISMPCDDAEFERARESCPCYEGISINADVAQCTHAWASSGGEVCSVDSCPVLAAPTGDASAPGEKNG